MGPNNGNPSSDGLPCKDPASVIGATPDNQPGSGLNPGGEVPHGKQGK